MVTPIASRASTRCRSWQPAVLTSLFWVLTGCSSWEPEPPRPGPDGVIDIPAPNVTFAPPGGSVDFKGKVTCPPEMAPCTYRWDFGDGRTSTALDPGTISFDKLGNYRVTFTAVSADGVPDATPGEAHIAVWNGVFEDNFDRATVDWDAHGWRRPIRQDTAPYHDIVGGWLRIQGAYHLPGSTGIMAYPLVGDCHIEATIRRHEDPNTVHFSDIIVRMHPSKNNGSFIRVRVQEERSKYNDMVEIGVFKIFDKADEHGWLINDDILHHELHHIDCIPAPQYGECPEVHPFPRNQDMRVTVDVLGNKITARLAAASAPSKILLTAAATDDIGEPYLYPGAVGVTQFEGTTYVDNFLLRLP